MRSLQMVPDCSLLSRSSHKSKGFLLWGWRLVFPAWKELQYIRRACTGQEAIDTGKKDFESVPSEHPEQYAWERFLGLGETGCSSSEQKMSWGCPSSMVTSCKLKKTSGDPERSSFEYQDKSIIHLEERVTPWETAKVLLLQTEPGALQGSFRIYDREQHLQGVWKM